MSETTGRELIVVEKKVTIGSSSGYLVKALKDCKVAKNLKADLSNLTNVLDLKKGESVLLNGFDLCLTLSREEYRTTCSCASGRDIYFYIKQCKTLLPLAGYSNTNERPKDPIDLTTFETIEDLPVIPEGDLSPEDIEYIKNDEILRKLLLEK